MSCPVCGSVLDGSADTGIVRQQVFELPAVLAIVTEHRMVTRRCACGCQITGVAPAAVNAPVEYGPGARAAMMYLAAGHADPGFLAARGRLIGDAALPGAASGAPGKVGARHRAPAWRIGTRIDDYLRLATTPGLPPDNNAAEREVRMIKVGQNISGCHRTLDGAVGFTRARSYLATALKQGRNAYQVLIDLFNGHAWTPAIT